MKSLISLVIIVGFIPGLSQARFGVITKPPLRLPSQGTGKAFSLNPTTRQVLVAAGLVASLLPPQVLAKFNYELGQASLGAETTQTMKESFAALGKVSRKIPTSQVEGMASAIVQSRKWDSITRANVKAFAQSLVENGISESEAKKLQEVEQNCRI